MAYDVEIDDRTVLPWILDCGLSPAAQERLIVLLDETLGRDGDRFRTNPALRIAPESFSFNFFLLLNDPGPRHNSDTSGLS